MLSVYPVDKERPPSPITGSIIPDGRGSISLFCGEEMLQKSVTNSSHAVPRTTPARKTSRKSSASSLNMTSNEIKTRGPIRMVPQKAALANALAQQRRNELNDDNEKEESTVQNDSLRRTRTVFDACAGTPNLDAALFLRA
jgi:hypothetical protein